MSEEASAGLERLLLDHPLADDDALVHTITTSTTRAEVVAMAAKVAAHLHDMGVAPGQAVAVQIPNSAAAVAAMFGVWFAGAVFVPVNPRAPEAEADRVLTATSAAAIVRGVDEVTTIAGRHAPLDSGAALVLFTSGTTGDPKPIVHGHESYAAIIDRAIGAIRAPRSDVKAKSRAPMPNLVPVSLALNAGIYNVLFALRVGAPVVLMDRFETGEFANLVARFGIRSTVLPPAALRMLLDDPAVTSLEPLRFVRSITAPLAPEHARAFADRFGAAVLNSYGQAELGEVIGWTAADAREHPEKLGAAGRPHPGVDVRVDGESELWVRPPSAVPDSLATRTDAEGYVRTGDLARIDDDGFVWVVGRVSDMINRGGNKVVPGEVEAVLRAVRGVADVAVAGVPDDRLGEVPVAFVVASPGADPPDPAEMAAACREMLVPYKVPARFVIVPELARNEIGKVLRAQLVELDPGA